MPVREISGEDHSRWNKYVESHAASSPYHLAGWCAAIRAAYGHDHVLLVSESEGRINGVLPLVLMRSPVGSAKYCSLPFCDVGGCLADNEDVEAELLRAAIDLARAAGAALHIRTRSHDVQRDAADYSGKVSMLLDLPQSSDELSASFKAKLRSQIRKAEKNGLEFEIRDDAEQLESFYHVFSRNMRDLGSPVHSKGWFESVRSNLAGNHVIGVVRLDEQPVAAGIVVTAAGFAAIPWASTLAEYNRLAPNMLLYWNLLKHCTDAGCSKFDFGRSTIDEGTYRFKKQWGAQPARLVWRDFDHSGAFMDDDGHPGRARAFAASVWRRLPLPLANRLGPHLRKHISL